MRFSWLAAAAAITLSTSANAATIYISSSNGTLTAYDTVTTNSSSVTTTYQGSAKTLTDIAFNNQGALYGSDTQVNGTNVTSSLYSIASNGNLTLIGSGIGAFISSLGFGTNGVLYGASGTAQANGGGQLYSISTSTGAGSAIGNLGAGIQARGDLTVFNNALYFASNQGLATVNTGTGQATVIGGDANIVGLAAADGRLYGVRDNDANVYTINTGTGVASLYSSNYSKMGYTATGAASQPLLSGAVPEPATWAMMVLGFGAVGYGMRRRPTARMVQAV